MIAGDAFNGCWIGLYGLCALALLGLAVIVLWIIHSFSK